MQYKKVQNCYYCYYYYYYGIVVGAVQKVTQDRVVHAILY